jgi:hypothetical protein
LEVQEKKLPESPSYHPGDLVEVASFGRLGVVTGYYWNPRHFFWEYLVFVGGKDAIYSCKTLKLVQRKEKNGIIEVYQGKKTSFNQEI